MNAEHRQNLEDAAFIVACWFIIVIALFALHAHGQTVTKNASQLQVPASHWSELPDGGCTVQPVCAFNNPQVRCDSTPEPARAAMCAAVRQSALRAAANANAVGDGGQP